MLDIRELRLSESPRCIPGQGRSLGQRMLSMEFRHKILRRPTVYLATRPDIDTSLFPEVTMVNSDKLNTKHVVTRDAK